MIGPAASLQPAEMSTKRICSVCGTEYDARQKFCPDDGTPLRDADATDGLVGQIIADRYRVLSTLGEGGMGRVYLAEHVRMGRQCAVKVISPALATTDAAIARFNREAANASQINHPNVVQVYDFGEGPDRTLYLAMEFIDGETLSAIIRREGPLGLRRAATLTKQVADALAAAHHRGIVHRDLKPDNILVTRHHDRSEWVKVVDFGIAKTVQADGAIDGHGGQTVTTAGVSIGTPEYMSPEQLAGERLDTRTDLYSLGLVFFNLLTADLPYPRVTSRENLIRRLTTPPRTLAEVRPSHSWPPSLQPVLDRALATEPDNRYATAGDFARDLSTLIAAAPPDPDITLPLRSAGTARPSAPTVREHVPIAPVAPAATPPRVAAPTQRRTMPLIVGLATLIVIAGASYALWSGRTAAPTTPVPVTGDSVVASAATVPAASPADTTQRVVSPNSDSVQPRATTPTPTRSATASPAAPAPAPQSTADSNRAPVPPALQRIRQSLVQRHAYLRPNGDSTAATPLPLNAPLPARISAIQQEVDGHISRGRRYVIAGNVADSRAEFRQAVQEVTNVLTVLPNNPEAIALRDSTSRSLRNIVMQCQTALQRGAMRPPEPNFRCPSLVPGRFLGGRRGG